MTPALLSLAVAFLLAGALTPLVRWGALRWGLVAETRSDRWHRSPTPAVGGVAIFAAFAAASAAGTLLLPETEALHAHLGPELHGWTALHGVLVVAAGVFVLGLVDDLRPLRPLTKLAGQVVGAGVLVASGVLLSLTGIYPLDVALTFLWVVGITNAVNLLDNMDGLAAGVAGIAAAFLGAILLLDGLPQQAVVAFALAGAAGGFLLHNHPPARIFMGDSGALLLGVVLAGLALSPAPGAGRGVATLLAVPGLLLAVPILDTALVTASRVAEGRPVSQGGRDHVSHRLVRLGVPERRAVHVLWGLTLAGGTVAFLLRTEERELALLLMGLLLLGFVLLGGHLLRLGLRERLEEGEGVRGYVLRLRSLHRRFPFVRMALDGAVVVLAFYGAHLLRWEGPRLAVELEYFREALPLVLAAKVVAFTLAGYYRSRESEATGSGTALAAMERLLRGNLLASLLAAGFSLALVGFGLSRAVAAIDFVLCAALQACLRVAEAAYFHSVGRRDGREGEGRPVVLAGDADEVEILLRTVRSRPELGLEPRGVWLLENGEPKPVHGVDGSGAAVPPEAARGSVRSNRDAAPGSSDGATPLFLGEDGLERALEETGARAVVSLRDAGELPRPPEAGLPSCSYYRLELTLLPVHTSLGEPGH